MSFLKKIVHREPNLRISEEFRTQKVLVISQEQPIFNPISPSPTQKSFEIFRLKLILGKAGFRESQQCNFSASTFLENNYRLVLNSRNSRTTHPSCQLHGIWLQPVDKNVCSRN